MKNYISINNKKIEISQETADSLKAQFNKKDKGLPVMGERFWRLDDSGIRYCEFTNHDFDKSLIARNNFYLTEEEAQKADNKRLALGTIFQYIRDNDLEYTPDWGDVNRDKYYIDGWNYNNDRPIANFGYRENHSSHNLIFKSEEDRQLVLDNCAKELETLLRD